MVLQAGASRMMMMVVRVRVVAALERGDLAVENVGKLGTCVVVLEESLHIDP